MEEMRMDNMTVKQAQQAKRLLSAWSELSIKERSGKVMWVADALLRATWAELLVGDAMMLVGEVKKRGIAAVRGEIEERYGAALEKLEKELTEVTEREKEASKNVKTNLWPVMDDYSDVGGGYSKVD